MTEENKKAVKPGTKTVVLIISCLCLLVTCVFAASVLLNKRNNTTDLTGTEITTENEFKNENVKTGFPVSFSGQIDNVALTDTSVYVLTNNEVTILSSRGNYIGEYILNFTDPMIKTSKAYAIAYDRQGSSYKIFGRKNMLSENKTEDGEQIITASVADDGKYLISTRSKDATSALTYYSAKGEIIYRWLCVNEHIVSADIAPNGNNIICAALDSKNGKLFTKVYFFDINSKKNNREFTFLSTAAADCFFTSSRNAVVVCNNKRIFIKCTRDAEPVKSAFASTILKRSTDISGNTAVLTLKTENPEYNVLTLYDSSNEIVFQTDVTSDVKDIACFSNKVYLLTDESVIRISTAEKSEEVIKTEAKCDRLIINSNGIYHYTNTALYCN